MTTACIAFPRRLPADGARLADAPAAEQPRRLRAVSADAALLHALSSAPEVGLVHSVFDRVVNVDIGRGRLLTLAHRDSDDAPDTVVADVETWRPLRFEPGMGVIIAPQAILLGDGFVVALDEARPWRARLPGYTSDDRTLHASLALAQDYLEQHGCGVGLDRSFGKRPTALDQAMAAAFRRHAEGLYEALARGDEAVAVEHAGGLVGLGPGLTPAGDDFLLGLLAALNVPGSPQAAWRCIGAQVVARAARRTHLISAAALRHAANGRVRDRIVTLCRALMQEPAAAMLAALDGVMRIGSSSGTEIALGVLAGFRLHLNAGKTGPRPAAQDRCGDDHGS